MPLGDHVMGVTMAALLTGHPIAEWGERWATSGSMEVTFRAHVRVGDRLCTRIERRRDDLRLEVTDRTGVCRASASASIPPPASEPPEPSDDVAVSGHAVSTASPVAVPPERAALEGLVLAPISFVFDADRDLAFTERLTDGRFWQDRRWAHPAWLAAGSNALVRRSIAFDGPEGWLHAGIRWHSTGSVPDGSTVVLTGRIAELRDTTTRRFAVAGVDVRLGTTTGTRVAELRNSFVYGRVPD